jgi:hypothetical protein
LTAQIGAGIEGNEQLAWMERGVADEPNIQAALDNLVDRAGSGDIRAAELGMAASA